MAAALALEVFARAAPCDDFITAFTFADLAAAGVFTRRREPDFATATSRVDALVAARGATLRVATDDLLGRGAVLPAAFPATIFFFAGGLVAVLAFGASLRGGVRFVEAAFAAAFFALGFTPEAFVTVVFPAAAFFAEDLPTSAFPAEWRVAAGFLAAGCSALDWPAFLPTAAFFGAGFLATGFLATGFRATGFFAPTSPAGLPTADFFSAGFFVAGLDVAAAPAGRAALRPAAGFDCAATAGILAGGLPTPVVTLRAALRGVCRSRLALERSKSSSSGGSGGRGRGRSLTARILRAGCL